MDAVLDVFTQHGVVEPVAAVVEPLQYPAERGSKRAYSVKTRDELDRNAAAMCPAERDSALRVRANIVAVQLVCLGNPLHLVAPHQTGVVDESGKRAHRVRAARVAKHVYLVALIVVEGEERVQLLDVAVDAIAHRTTHDAVAEAAGRAQPGVVKHGLLDASVVLALDGERELDDVGRLL